MIDDNDVVCFRFLSLYGIRCDQIPTHQTLTTILPITRQLQKTIRRVGTRTFEGQTLHPWPFPSWLYANTELQRCQRREKSVNHVYRIDCIMGKEIKEQRKSGRSCIVSFDRKSSISSYSRRRLSELVQPGKTFQSGRR